MSIIIDLIHEFDKVVDESVGLYLDSQAAMRVYVEHLTNRQLISSSMTGIPTVELDRLSFSYGTGDPNDRDSMHLYSTTQGELRRRNDNGGKNRRLLGQRFIVDLYAFWEDEYRSRLAVALGVHRGEIASDIFGDIRILRNSIIHHQGIALPAVEQCKILTWFKTGDTVQLDEEQFHTVIVEIRKWLEEFGRTRTGVSPKIAGRLGPTGHRHIGPE